MRNKKWFIFFIVLFSLFCIYEVSAQYGGSFGFESGQSIVDLYREYASWFDFAIFLFIFLGLGRAIFGEHFKGAGGTGVYIGIGIFLALALLIWEEQAGFSLIEVMGPWVLFLFILVLLFLTFMFILKAGGGVLLAASVTYIIFFLIYAGAGYYLEAYYFDFSDLVYQWTRGVIDFDTLDPLMRVLAVLSVIGVIVGVILVKKHGWGGFEIKPR